MRTKTISRLTGCEYIIEDVCRIINPLQQTLYIKHGIYPIDMYASIDSKTEKDITVMIFDRKETYPLYQKWCDHELK